MTTDRAPDVVVVGAGLVGCTIALRLAEAGASVMVLERSVPGAEASSVAAGILGPGIEATEAGPLLRLGIRSRERHFSLAEQLRADHGIDVGCRRCGVLRVHVDEASEREGTARRHMLDVEGVRTEWLDTATARAREPALSPSTRSALFLPDEAQVEPRALLRAVAVASERAGVTFRTGTVVRGLRVESDRVLGVELDDGFVATANVVVAAGAWTSLVPGMPASARAIYPVRGQLLASLSRPPLFRSIVFGEGVYVVTRPDGRLLLGATMEEVGFDRSTTLGAVVDLVTRSTRVAPGIADLPLVEHAVSFRPATRDHLPLIGRGGPEGLFVASGHHRNGVLLAPITADLVADALVRGRDLDDDADLVALRPVPRANGRERS